MSGTLLFSALLSAGSPALHIVSSSIADDFERALRLERPALHLATKEDATVSARLERRTDRLELRIEDLESSRLRLERTLPITGEIGAALRVAVLLTLSTLDGEDLAVQTSTSMAVSPASETESLHDQPGEVMFALHLVAGSGLWVDQPAPQLSFVAGLIGQWSWLRAGVQVGAHGIFCCDRENELIESSWTELAVGGLAGATLFDSTDLRLSVDLGASLLAIVGRAAPKAGVFASAGLPVAIDRLGLELLAAAEVELPLTSSFSLLGRGGLRLTPIGGTIELPEAFQSLGAPLETPWGGPFFHLGIRFIFF